jgi:ribosomal protein L7Ae-like RNA K-turn-binding protein
MYESIHHCIACNRQSETSNLLRVVKTLKGKIEFDPEGNKSGSGVYFCSNSDCIQVVRKKNLIDSVFKTTIPFNLYLEIAEYYYKETKESIITILCFAVRARKCIFGITSVTKCLKKGKIKLVILSEEISEKTNNKIRNTSNYFRVPVVIYSGKKSLEHITGKINCQCLGIIDKIFSDKLLKLFDKDKNYEPKNTRSSGITNKKNCCRRGY